MRRLLIALALLCAWPAGAATNFFIDPSDAGSTRLGTLAEPYVNPDSALEGAAGTNLYGDACAAGDSFFWRPNGPFTLTSNIELFMDGTASNPIVIWGDMEHRWWQTAADSAAVRPTITLPGDFYFNQAGDEFWVVHGVHFDNYTLYCWANSSVGLLVDDCVFTNAGAATDYALYVATATGTVVVTDCQFDGSALGGDGADSGVGIRAGNSPVYVSGCSFGDLSTAITGGSFYVTNCSFGQAPEGVNGVDAGSPTMKGIFIRGGTLNDNSKLAGTANSPIGRYYRDGSARPMLYWETGYLAAAISDYSTVNAGGGDYSIKYSVTSTSVGTMNPVKLMEYTVDADSAESRTYVVAAYRDVNFPAPTAAQLYLEVTYQSGDTLLSVQSSATLDADSTWYDLSVGPLAPNHGGPVMCTVWLETYDANGFIWLDPRLDDGESRHETIHWGMPELASMFPAPAGGMKRVLIIN